MFNKWKEVYFGPVMKEWRYKKLQTSQISNTGAIQRDFEKVIGHVYTQIKYLKE